MILLVSGVLMIGSGRKISWAWSPFVFFFFFPRVPSGLDAHDLSHSTPSEPLEKAKYDRPGERSPE